MRERIPFRDAFELDVLACAIRATPTTPRQGDNYTRARLRATALQRELRNLPLDGMVGEPKRLRWVQIAPLIARSPAHV